MGHHPPNKMEIANLRLRLNKIGNDIPVFNATPAEAMVLHIMHQANNGGSSFGEDMDKITVLGEEERSNTAEYNRLKAKYGKVMTKKGDSLLSLIFPNKFNLTMPQKFADLDWTQIVYDGQELQAAGIGTDKL